MDAARAAAGLDDLATALTVALDDADASAAASIADAAYPFTPRRTGRLAAGTVAIDGTVTNTERYAPFVHDDHPFLVEAAESVDWAAAHLDAVQTAVDNLR